MTFGAPELLSENHILDGFDCGEPDIIILERENP